MLLTTTLLIAGPTLALLAGGAAVHWWHTRKQRSAQAWPTAFSLTARPLFTTEERLLFRELQAALPQHVVLAKVNLLRFCHATRESEARLWFERLHPLNVSFVVCTPHGTVISAIDLEAPNRPTSGRTLRLKESVLDACRVRYLRVPSGQRLDPHALAQLALGAQQFAGTQASAHGRGSGVTGASAPSPLAQARAELARKLQHRRTERAHRNSGGRDTGFTESTFGDSFFAMDSRFDADAANSAPTPLSAPDAAGLAAAGSR
jgi:Protein of unknown function (DUF2726)